MRALVLASSLLGLPLAACSTTSASATAADYDNVARDVGATTAAPNSGDASAMLDVVMIASGDLPLGMTIDATGHVGGDVLGISYDFMVTCRDGQGTTLARCNSYTQIADVAVDWSGTLTLPGFTTTMDRHGDWSLMNLQDPSVKLAGNGAFTYDSTITDATTQIATAYHLDYRAAYVAVWIDKDQRIPTAGEIQYEIDAEKTVGGQATRSFSIDADVVFEGDGTALLTLDGDHHYAVDLATGGVTTHA